MNYRSDNGARIVVISSHSRKSKHNASGYDVIVIGGGNAAFCAALAARENGASVLVLECAPIDERGGNSRFTAGAMRVAYNGVDDLARLMPDLTAEDKATTDFGAYSSDQFYDDLCRVTQYRTDPRIGRDAGHPQLRDHALDAQQRRPLRTDLWTAGLQG